MFDFKSRKWIESARDKSRLAIKSAQLRPVGVSPDWGLMNPPQPQQWPAQCRVAA